MLLNWLSFKPGELQYFRHFIRHSYSSELKWDEMEILVKNLEEMWEIIKNDFELIINED